MLQAASSHTLSSFLNIFFMLQAASSNTLSSEDSLSVKSISVDGTPDHEQVK